MSLMANWKACVEDLDAGAYDIVLKVSTSKLILDYIEFITFTIHPNMNSSYTDFYDFNDRVNEFFELRVNEWVCKFETIIVRILNSIRVFFFIFAAGLLAFTIAFLHLLQGCVQAPCLIPSTLFPRHFYRAFSADYFFMGGRYDPVGQEMDSENWVFLTLMLLFFLFTVILMLNVLIGDETWRLVWLANRLRYFESAETLSWQIPGFRQWYGYFPKYIYYTASPQQVKAFWNRHLGLLEPADQKAVDEKASAKPNADETITYNALYGVEKEQSSTGSRAISPSGVEKILQEFKEQMLRQSQEASQRLMQEFKEQMLRQSQEANQRLMQEFKDQLTSETRRALQESKARD
ncbi:hypothetical protein CPC16_009410 [Podila verticillata]|nr:hypothetical protein CPC16_009410 [Podila verticillata]